MAWLHRALNPHCPDCILERQENNICRSCETLQMEIERLRQENNKLLEYILEKPKEFISPIDEGQKVVLPRSIPWNVRKQMLENEDREKAKLMKRQQEMNPIEKLEQELGVNDATV